MSEPDEPKPERTVEEQRFLSDYAVLKGWDYVNERADLILAQARAIGML